MIVVDGNKGCDTCPGTPERPWRTFERATFKASIIASKEDNYPPICDLCLEEQAINEEIMK